MRWEKPFNAIALITALMFVALFISITAMDSFQYEHRINSFHAAEPMKLQNSVVDEAKVRAPKLESHAAESSDAAKS